MSKAEAVLVDHQLQRLKQLSLQFEYASRSDEGFELLTGLKPKLGLSAADETKLDEAILAARKEFETKVNGLRKRLDKQVVDVLSEESQQKLKDLVGEFFYFERNKKFP
jgi:hypothetical protein